MSIDIIYNKWFVMGIVALIGLITYRLFFTKNKTDEILEKEYAEIVNSDEYKVKGQYD